MENRKRRAASHACVSSCTASRAGIIILLSRRTWGRWKSIPQEGLHDNTAHVKSLQFFELLTCIIDVLVLTAKASNTSLFIFDKEIWKESRLGWGRLRL